MCIYDDVYILSNDIYFSTVFAAVLVFSLPVESGEKVGLGINAMLAMMVFLMAMIENLPPSENIPLAGQGRIATFP